MTVNGKHVDENYIMNDGDKLIHTIDKVETPILNVIPNIIFEGKYNLYKTFNSSE